MWAPLIYDGTTKIEPPDDPDYHFTTDMTDQAITWTRYQQSLTPDKPFFVYFSTGATHAPHHVPAEWIAKYAGKFDGGWDEYREQTLARQIELARQSWIAAASSARVKCATPDFSACVLAPPSSSKLTSSCVTVFTTSGPVTNMKLVPSVITMKSVIAGE